MSVLENPEVLKQQITVNKNIDLPLNVYKIDYVTYESNSDYNRKTAYILSESPEAAEHLVIKSVNRGVPIQWEQRAGMICSIHGITESLQRTL
ncbi:MAG: hypothetical protein JSV31_00005, partial [Desulfobacterales bacterium]